MCCRCCCAGRAVEHPVRSKLLKFTFAQLEQLRLLVELNPQPTLQAPSTSPRGDASKRLSILPYLSAKITFLLSHLHIPAESYNERVSRPLPAAGQVRTCYRVLAGGLTVSENASACYVIHVDVTLMSSPTLSNNIQLTIIKSRRILLVRGNDCN